MTLRLVLRTILARPVRAAVLAGGFGFGIAVMAALLGVGEVIVEQSRAPALRGGGDLVVTGRAGDVHAARFLLSSVLGAPPLAGRAAGASPTVRDTLYLVQGDRITRLRARGGVPSLERAVGDPETATVEAWRDAPADRTWTAPRPEDVLRAMDRFHAVPDVPARAASWAEWLYFSGQTPDGSVRFYLTFMAGPRAAGGTRAAGVRLQLERQGRVESFSARAGVPEEALLARAPDMDIASSRVRLEGLRYRIVLDLASDDGGPRLRGEITLDAVPGRSVPPFVVRGRGGWLSGYVVPVLSGAVAGTLRTGARRVSLDGATGYHDHNWGFWQGVTWQWGQVSHEGLSFLYGRIVPPEDARPPGRASGLPGILAVVGPSGPLAFARQAVIEETSATPGGPPETVRITARERGLDLQMEARVEDAVRTRLFAGPGLVSAGGRDFLQLRASFRVLGRIGDQAVDFRALGAAETFRDPPP
ncbi:MAG TPA: hypothetical protein VMT87_15100 [Vicinamibacteria bacterium]|nr:hypothetical protein [Vicinamibacteria bacterium]